MRKELPVNKKIILFDGVCNLCNTSVDFIIKRDTKDVFRFASLQSDLGMQLLAERGIDTQKIDSIVYIDPGNTYEIKSDAALAIAAELKGWPKVISYFKFLPTGFRNTIYDIVAKNRYRWFGKKNTCRLPTEQETAKFL